MWFKGSTDPAAGHAETFIGTLNMSSYFGTLTVTVASIRKFK